MKNKFKTGDLVELRSGSPLMTVQEYKAKKVVICQWYNYDTYSFHTFTLLEDQLELKNPKPLLI